MCNTTMVAITCKPPVLVNASCCTPSPGRQVKSSLHKAARGFRGGMGQPTPVGFQSKKPNFKKGRVGGWLRRGKDLSRQEGGNL